MKIETKFDPSQEVWVLYDNKAVKQIVAGVYVSASVKGESLDASIIYDIQFCAGSFKESDVFESKESLLQSL